MAIKAIVTKLEDAPEALREHYAEKDGKFYLSVDAVDGYALEDVTGLKSALGAERTKREQLEAAVVKFKDLDPDKARAALTELEELKKIDPSKEADKIANTKFEAAKAQLMESHKREIEARDGRLGKLTGLVDNLARRQEAIAAIAAEKGSVDLLLPHVLSVTKSEIGDEAEAVKIKVLQPDGNERVNGKGEAMSIRELVAEMKGSETFARAFDGDGHTGSGKEHDKGDGGGSKKGDFGGTREERRAAIAQKFKLPA